jgi:hypothetical protein
MSVFIRATLCNTPENGVLLTYYLQLHIILCTRHIYNFWTLYCNNYSHCVYTGNLNQTELEICAIWEVLVHSNDYCQQNSWRFFQTLQPNIQILLTPLGLDLFVSVMFILLFLLCGLWPVWTCSPKFSSFVGWIPCLWTPRYRPVWT